jgi:hypothetical protein
MTNVPDIDSILRKKQRGKKIRGDGYRREPNKVKSSMCADVNMLQDYT